ncbi:glycosyltransferase [Agromyces seonyuensis]|uniref:Glycosyltransferase n=1 Tax=Agromyces seonyuensis TaxID=2662446 RepID=A0A6I4NZX6_9MICO|nr:glycosyltransferase [Agromyces seonyuensis]
MPDADANPLIVAVVPTFRPEHETVEHLALLSTLVDRVIVVDDGSGSAADAVLEEVSALAGVDVVRHERNSGIARALNTGVERALADDADYVLTLDQDTALPADYVQRCLETFARASDATRLGIVATDRVNGAPAIPSSWSPEGLGLVPEAIQSGMLVSRDCLETAGGFDERLVIDCVDTEYCIRVGDLGFRIAIAEGADIRHALGEMVPYRPFGRLARNRNGTFEYQYHSPFRQYYIVRNNVDLVLRFAGSHGRWTLAVVKRQIGPAIDAVLSGPHRFRHLIATLVGFAHGVFRVRGLIPARLRRFLTAP